MIYFADRRDHAIPFFVDANLLPLSFLYYEYVSNSILQHEKFLQFDWLRVVVFQLNLKYLHVNITNLLWVVV